MPAEWEAQSGILLTWPRADGDWAALLPEVEPVFHAIALAIAHREIVLVLCADQEQRERVRSALLASGAPAANLLTTVTASNDTWSRDFGPLTVLDRGQPRLLDFTFNGWGGKYRAQLDNAVTGQLHRQGLFGSTPCETPALVLEGGSIDSDGAGTLLTTASCLLQPGRNPGLSRQALEIRLRRLLGVQRLLWLEHGGLAGDDTDGHVDMLARFCSTSTIAFQTCDEPGYSHYEELRTMARELQQFRTPGGEAYQLVGLPWPGVHCDHDGQRLPASYANFLVLNGAVLLPVYGVPADDEAARLLQDCFAEREVVQVPCRSLIRQYGSLHCLTMQFPQGVLSPPQPYAS